MIGVPAALVHDFFCNLGGSDKVVAALHELLPDAPIYTLVVYDRNRTSPLLEGMELRTSFIQRLPFAGRTHQVYLPLFPLALRSFDLSTYRLVVSSSHSAVKAVSTPKETVHVCYCHTPMRYAWDMREPYLASLAPVFRPAARLILDALRRWDRETAGRPDHFVANSSFVADRVRRYYHRDATVVHPPVEVHRFRVTRRVEDYFLVVARLVPYKRIDLAVQAFARLPWPLLVVGDGPERQALERQASANVRFLGWRPDDEVAELMSKARGFVFPGVEDFGITAVESQAAGRPVVAFRGGGALDSLIEDETGVFFDQQEPESLAEAVARCRDMAWDPERIRSQALTFAPEVFQRNMREVLVGLLKSSRAPAAP